MIRFAVRDQMNIDEQTWNEAKDQVSLLVSVARERVTAEFAEILVLEGAEDAIRMLEQIGYWDVFVPELARLRGIVQNQYHSLDVWEHTLAVFRNTPQDLFLRLAALFHDVGKWEVASKECYLGGKLEFENNQYWIDDYQIIGTRGKGELEYKLKPYIGKDLKILGAQLDQYPETVQLKKVLTGEQIIRGITAVENGKRHFLNHEKASGKILEDILQRYSFSMFFDGGGQKREKNLIKLVENHMRATLVFMPEFRGESAKRPFRYRAAELVWEICWDGREFELQNIHDFVVLWKADFEAGKVHSEEQNKRFEDIRKELMAIALWQQENLPNVDWDSFREFTEKEGLTGPRLGRFKDFVRARLMKEMAAQPQPDFWPKAYAEYSKRK
jgi:poly(A) polymerase